VQVIPTDLNSQRCNVLFLREGIDLKFYFPFRGGESTEINKEQVLADCIIFKCCCGKHEQMDKKWSCNATCRYIKLESVEWESILSVLHTL